MPVFVVAASNDRADNCCDSDNTLMAGQAQHMTGTNEQDGETRDVQTFAHTLEGAHLGSIFHGMNSKIDFRHGFLFANGSNSIIDLLIATVLE